MKRNKQSKNSHNRYSLKQQAPFSSSFPGSEQMKPLLTVLFFLSLAGSKVLGKTLNGGLDIHFFDIGQGMSQLLSNSAITHHSSSHHLTTYFFLTSHSPQYSPTGLPSLPILVKPIQPLTKRPTMWPAGLRLF